MRFALISVAALALAMFIAVTHPGPAVSQGVVPEESLLMTACTTARQLAILGGVNVEKCRLVSQMDEGQTALITVKVKVTGQGWFSVAAAYQRSVWNQSALQVTPLP
jgi:hypothetical protein